MGRLVFEKSRHNQIITILLQSFRELGRLLKMKTTLEEVEQFFIGSVRETVEYREKNNVTRNDFMDLLLKIRNGKKLNESDTETLSGLSINELAAQGI